MTAACDIPILLAQGAGDYNLIIFIVVAVLLAVSGLIKRASEKKQEQAAAEATRKAAQRQRQEPKRSPQAPRPAQQAGALHDERAQRGAVVDQVDAVSARLARRCSVCRRNPPCRQE